MVAQLKHAEHIIHNCNNLWPTAVLSVFELFHVINVGVDMTGRCPASCIHVYTALIMGVYTSHLISNHQLHTK